jgi:hypothetical protein
VAIKAQREHPIIDTHNTNIKDLQDFVLDLLLMERVCDGTNYWVVFYAFCGLPEYANMLMRN